MPNEIKNCLKLIEDEVQPNIKQGNQVIIIDEHLNIKG